jgi:hypothetical protein
MTAIVAAIVGVLLYWHHWIGEQRAAERAAARRPATAAARPAHPAPLPGARTFETAHYAILSTADDTETRHVGAAVEALRNAYAEMFPGRVPASAGDRLRLTLYADQRQFKANNRSRPWAEAYYLRPVCYAYVAADAPSPYHWMLHEATHQLNAEVARLPKYRWVEEGLGTYFGTSRYEGGRLWPGRIDPETYPIWHLHRMHLSGSLDADIRAGRWIPIEALITGIDAPPIDANVNLYYLQYWSLSHFLFHGGNGRYAAGYRRVIAEGGTLENVRRYIGPPERLEGEWYEYLQSLIARHAPDPGIDAVTVVVGDNRD